MTITATFDQGTDPDTAQVQVQNKLNLATPLLPQEVQQQGIRVTKAVLNHFGLPGGFPRKPRLPITDERLTRSLELVKGMNLPELAGL